MCFASREIKVPHSHRTMMVPCGHCPACLGQKASRRARRIRCHHPAGFTCYFVTLSYSNDFIPFIRKSDLFEFQSDSSYYGGICHVPVYRSKTCRFFKSVLHTTDDEVVLRHIDVPHSALTTDNINSLSCLVRSGYSTPGYRTLEHDRVCVNNYDDVKRFFKRLRFNLSQCFGNVPLSYYSTAEYGPTTQRLHYHLALWLPSCIAFEDVRTHVSKAWPFCDRSRTEKFVQVAKCLSSYLAQYINCGTDVSDFLQDIAPLKSSHSLLFGFDDVNYEFRNVVSTLSEGMACSFTQSVVDSRGAIQYVDFSYPKYVVYRYFPIIKGFSRLDDLTAVHIISDPQKYARLYTSLHVGYLDGVGSEVYQSNIRTIDNSYLCFSLDEFNQMVSRIDSRYRLYFSHMSRLDYALLVVKCLRNYSRSFYIKSCLECNSLSDVIYNYDNIAYAPRLTLDIDSSTFDALNISIDSLYDSDSFPSRLELNNHYSEKFYTNIKQRKLNEL